MARVVMLGARKALLGNTVYFPLYPGLGATVPIDASKPFGTTAQWTEGRRTNIISCRRAG